jgi:hypothetical protein
MPPLLATLSKLRCHQPVVSKYLSGLLVLPISVAQMPQTAQLQMYCRRFFEPDYMLQ